MSDTPSPDDALTPAITQLLSRGFPPSQVANLFDLDLETVIAIAESTPRQAPTTDDEQLTVAMSQYARRAFDEGMRLLDEGTPAIKVRLIQGAMGHTLRFLNSHSPKELDDIRDEMSGMFKDISTDDSDPDSIYARYRESPVYYDPSSVTVDEPDPEDPDNPGNPTAP